MKGIYGYFNPRFVFFGTDEAGNVVVEHIGDNSGHMLEREEIEAIIRYCKWELKEFSAERREFENYKRDKEHEEENEKYRAKRKIETEAKKKEPSIIYIIRDTIRGFYKIGITRGKLESRMSQLKTANPSIELVCNYIGSILDEQSLHAHLTQVGKHVGGEWFSLEQSDLDFVQSYFQSNNTLCHD